MLPEALLLLESRLTRLRSDHESRLLSIGNSALKKFDPMRKSTLGLSLGAYVEEANAELEDYCHRVRKEVIAVAEELLMPLSEEEVAAVIDLAAKAFDEDLYMKRIQAQEAAMVRCGARYGLAVNEWGIRTDLEHAKHHVASINFNRRSLSLLADELKVMRLRSFCEASASMVFSGSTSMPFSKLMNDTVELLKADGSRVTGLKASVQRNKIYMDAGKLVVEPGDLIVRKMSNGIEETYRITDPVFYEAFGGIPSNYQMEVQKLGLPEARNAVQSITYNINGNNARINQNSIDNSSNAVQIDARATQHINALRSELNKLPIAKAEKAAAHEVVDEVEGALQSGKPKKSVVTALLQSLPHAANITSIVAALISLL